MIMKLNIESKIIKSKKKNYTQKEELSKKLCSGKINKKKFTEKKTKYFRLKNN